MKKLFLDTNILIDILLERCDYKEGSVIMSMGKEEGYEICVSVLTMANLAYILRKTLKGEALYTAIENITQSVTVLSLTSADFEHAVRLRSNDFEDALQYYCAQANMCDAIITRNKKDFLFSSLPVFSPIEYIEKKM